MLTKHQDQIDEQAIVSMFTRIIQRPDGSEVELVARALFSLGLKRSVGFNVFRRESENQPWRLCSDRPHSEWREMQLCDYHERGRSEKYRTASHGEILNAASMIVKPKAAIPPGTVFI